MKRYFTPIMFFLTFITLNLKGQVSKHIIEQFPAAIVYRVQDIYEKTNMPEVQQLKLAFYFKKQDSLANIAISKSDQRSISLKSFYESDPEILKILLSPIEFNDYYADTSSIIRKVLSLRKELILSIAQINRLLKEQQALEDSLGVKGFDPLVMEKRVLSEVLSPAQNLNYFKEINRKAAHAVVLRQLTELKNNASLNADSAALYTILMEYELERSSTLAYHKKMGNKKTYDDKYSLFEATKPEILYRLEAYENASSLYRLLAAVYYTRELQLSDKQVTALLEQYRKLRRLEYERRVNSSKEKFDQRKHENRELSKTLTAEQLEAFFRKLNLPSAEWHAKKNLDKLKAYKLITNLEQEKAGKELVEYQMQLFLARERSYFAEDEKAAFNVAWLNIVEHKPQILLKLDVAIKREKESKVVRF